MPPKKDESLNEPTRKEIAEKHETNIKIVRISKIIEEYVFDELGKPNNFVECKVIHLFKDRYRVNIYVRDDNSLRISDSFYTRGSDDGCFYCDPKIIFKYGVKKNG